MNDLYIKEKYSCFCLFSKRNLMDNLYASYLLDNFINTFHSHLSQLQLKVGGTFRFEQLDFKAIRKTIYKTEKVNGYFSGTNNANEVNLFVFDKNFDAINPPKILINICSALKGKFKNENILEEPNSFILFAVSKTLNIENNHLEEYFDIIFKTYLGIKGAYWRITDYNLNNQSPIEWAQHNFPNCKYSNSLKEWNPICDKIYGS